MDLDEPISMILDAEPLIGRSSPQEDRSNDMDCILLQNKSFLEIHVRICQIDCKYRIVIAQVGPEQQGLHAIQKKLQAGEVTGILVENSICPASGYSDVAIRIEHSEGVAVLQRAPRAHRGTCCRDIEGLLLRGLDNGRPLRLRTAQLILEPFWRSESGPDRGSACS